MDTHEPYNTNNPDFTKKPVFWQIVVLMVVLIVIFSSAILNELSNLTSVAKPPAPTPGVVQNPTGAAAVITSQTPREVQAAISEIPLAAQAAHVFDMQTGTVLYEKNADAVLPLASITKLMTALLTHEILAKNETVTINLDAILQDGDSGLTGGERFSAEDLNDLVLMTSSNDGAFALADSAGAVLSAHSGPEAFITAMNIRAEELGLDSLLFYNATGLDFEDTKAPGALGSAADISALMAYIITQHGEILESTTELHGQFHNKTGAYHAAQNTNGTVEEIDGLIGSKTGYTELAGGNLVIAYDAGLNRPIVITVLGSSRTERFTDVLTLVQHINAALVTE